MAIRTHHCGNIKVAQIGSEVKVAGWVHRRRDHGGVIFFDLRDESGLVQVIFNPDDKENFLTAESCRNEYEIGRASCRERV